MGLVACPPFHLGSPMPSGNLQGILKTETGEFSHRPAKSRPASSGFPWESLLILVGFILLADWATHVGWKTGNDFHTSVEIMGSLVAILGGVVCLLYFLGLKERFYLVVSLGFFVAGVEDLAHGIISSQRFFEDPGVDFSRFIPATYVSGRFALALLIILAPVLEHRLKKFGSLKKEAILISVMAFLLGGGLVGIALAFPVPQLIFPGMADSRPMDFLSTITFLGALAILIKRYRERRDIFTRMLIASVVFNIGGQFYMSFSKELYDSYFDLAHLANVLSYFAPVLGISIKGLQEMIHSRMEIIERKRAQRKLRELNLNLEQSVNELFRTRSRHELVLESVDEGIIVTDPKKMIVTANRNAAIILERDRGIAPGSHLSDTFDFCAELEGIFAEPQDEESNHQIELEIGKEKTRTLDLRCSRLLGLKGEYSGWVFVIRDITSEKEIERMKDRFVASVSHELRTPLTSIKGFTATILRDPAMNTETRTRFLGIIDEESTRLANLIENLLEISRLSSPQSGHHKTEYRLKEVLLKVAANFEPNAREKEITVSSNIPSALPPLVGDPEKIQAVFVNLVGNAIKFSPPGSKVFLGAKETATGIAVQVVDNGCGIPEEEREKIFDRFYRVYRPGKETPGTGLGLSIAKEIVEDHQGEISVSEGSENGTCFSVVLPFCGSANHGHQKQATEIPAREQRVGVKKP